MSPKSSKRDRNGESRRTRDDDGQRLRSPSCRPKRQGSGASSHRRSWYRKLSDRTRHRREASGSDSNRRCGERQRRTQTRSRSRSPSYLTRGSASRSPVGGTAAQGKSDFAKLTEVLSAIIKAGSVRSNHYVNEKVLPEFDPEEKDLSAKEWLAKVNMYAVLLSVGKLLR
ncbi:serine/Arginine-related protein 53-like [Neodiprion pinetum]|uniref:serine/Arginine-related protein 53-like n=1 Tax=Neodiprion pinetum TaxID=441929 RepID=UPI00371842B1